jgi:His/Glu/Gln/Arg/opine family amino acid ABC transporter permease subunit
MRWTWVATYGSTYLDALGWTLLAALLASAGSMFWGSALFLIRLMGGRAAERGVGGYVQLFRNTPVLLPIYVIYFGFPLIGLPWPALACGAFALVLQNGAYVSEILRGSFKAIDRVQFDAGKSLGLSPWLTFRKITLPQVLVHSIPSLGNQVVVLIKDTSLLSAIAVTELTMQAKLLTERTGAAYEAFIVVAALYLVMVSATGALFRTAHRAVRWR